MANATITATSVISSLQNAGANGTAGEAIAAGEAVFLNANDNKIYRADGNDATKLPTADSRLFLALNSAGTGQPIRYLDDDDPALVIGTHGLTIGDPYFLSNTIGKFCPLADLTSGSYTNYAFTVTGATTVTWSPALVLVARP